MKNLLGFFCFCLCFVSACATGDWELREARLGGEIMLSVEGKVITIDLDTGVVVGESADGPRVRVLRWRVTSGAVVHGAGHDQRVDITSTHAAHDAGWRRCYDVRMLIQSVPLGHAFCTGPEPTPVQAKPAEIGEKPEEQEKNETEAKKLVDS